MKTKYRVGKRFVKGNSNGRRFNDIIEIKENKDIHDFLWDLTIKLEKGKIDFIIEWYTKIN